MGFTRCVCVTNAKLAIKAIDILEFTGVSLGNEQAKHLYRSVGFAETGMVEDNMEEMRYIC